MRVTKPQWGQLQLSDPFHTIVALTVNIFATCKPTTRIGTSEIDIRDFFRLGDTLCCEYKLISSDQIATQDPETLFDYSEEIQLIGQLKKLQRQGKGFLERIDVQNAEMAAYLNHLDEHVELIGRRLLCNEVKIPDIF